MIQKIDKKFENKLIALGIIAALSLIVYSNSFTAPFTLDDFGSISNNTSIRHPWDIPAIWKFYSNRFVLYFTFSLNYFIHQTGVVGYHIVNLVIHILNGFFVFLIIRSILGLRFFNKKIPGKYRNIISVICSAAFITHPVQVNAVTYVVQRTASLAALFYMMAVFFFIKFRLHDRIRYFALTLIFTVLAMFTKENTITIPFMLIVIELMFFLKDGKTSWKKRLLFIFILLATIPIIPSTTLFWGGYSQSDPNVSFKASTSMDRLHYFYTQMNVIVKYIKLMFIPDDLNFDYSNDFPVSKTIWENNSYISFLILLFIGIISLLNVKKNKLLSFGILWFFIGLSVESSFISIKDVYFEHRLYFPVAGFIIAMAGIIFSQPNLGRGRYIFKKPLLFFTVVMVFYISMNSALTLHRNYIFGSGIRLWTDVVRKAPGSDRAHCVLATNYMNAYKEKDPDTFQYLDIAEKEFKKAIELYYRNDTAHCNLSKVYLLKKDYQKCIDEANITNGIRKSEYAYFNLGSAYEKLIEPDKALDAYLKGYRVNDKATFLLKALGNLYSEKKDYKNAKFYYERFLEYNDYNDSKDIKKKLEDIDKKLNASIG